jgi:hypothetical protein
MHELVSLIIYTLAAFGFCWGVGHSKLTLPLRSSMDYYTRTRVLGRGPVYLTLLLMECPACLGFHVGWIAYALHVAPVFTSWYTAAFYTAGVNYLLGRVSGLITED